MDSSPSVRLLNTNSYNRPPYPYALSSGRAMTISIIVLFIVLILALAFHIYAKWFMRHNTQAAGHGHGHENHHRAGAAGVGLDKMTIDSLPVFTYAVPKASIERARSMKEEECAVCLSEFQEGEKGRLLPRCNHSFHTECIDMWFHSHSTCPLCRTPVIVKEAPVTGPNESHAQAMPPNDLSVPSVTTVISQGNLDNMIDPAPSAPSSPPSSSPLHNTYTGAPPSSSSSSSSSSSASSKPSHSSGSSTSLSYVSIQIN